MKPVEVPTICFGMGEVVFHPMTSGEATPVIVIRKLKTRRVTGSTVDLEDVAEAPPIVALDFRNRQGLEVFQKALSAIRFDGEPEMFGAGL